MIIAKSFVLGVLVIVPDTPQKFYNFVIFCIHGLDNHGSLLEINSDEIRKNFTSGNGMA